MATPPHPTATRAEVESVLRCSPDAPAVPIFLPAIYEHKAAFIDSTPSAISRDADLLTRALLAEYEAVGPDALAVGVDVYNLEAETVGCKVSFYEGADTSIPGIKPGNHVVKIGDDLSNAPLPNPLTDGRMPVNITAAANVRRELGDDYWLRGAISGPFSLAISLVGSRGPLPRMPRRTRVGPGRPRLLRSVSLRNFPRVTSMLARNWWSLTPKLPPNFSPRPCMKSSCCRSRRIWSSGPLHRACVTCRSFIGGNTTPIADLLAESGANNLLCDFTADFDEWADVCQQNGRSLRRNISPRLIETGSPEELYEVAAREIARGKDIPGFILGTAVVPFGSPTANLLAIKQACLDSASA